MANSINLTESIVYTGSLADFLKLGESERKLFDDYKLICLSSWDDMLTPQITTMLNDAFPGKWMDCASDYYAMVVLKPNRQWLRYYYADSPENVIDLLEGRESKSVSLYVDSSVSVHQMELTAPFNQYYLNCTRSVPPHPNCDRLTRTAHIRCSCAGGKCAYYRNTNKLNISALDDEDDKFDEE